MEDFSKLKAIIAIATIAVWGLPNLTFYTPHSHLILLLHPLSVHWKMNALDLEYFTKQDDFEEIKDYLNVEAVVEDFRYLILLPT